MASLTQMAMGTDSHKNITVSESELHCYRMPYGNIRHFTVHGVTEIDIFTQMHTARMHESGSGMHRSYGWVISKRYT